MEQEWMSVKKDQRAIIDAIGLQFVNKAPGSGFSLEILIEQGGNEIQG